MQYRLQVFAGRRVGEYQIAHACPVETSIRSYKLRSELARDFGDSRLRLGSQSAGNLVRIDEAGTLCCKQVGHRRLARANSTSQANRERHGQNSCR